MGVFLVLEKTSTELKIRLTGESHTLLNLLTSIMLEDERVDVAYYNMEFPTWSDPVLYIRTHGDDPVRVLKDASMRVAELCDEFIRTFNAASSSQ
ncbi:DNA-directed RNA polymerase subunit L [Methermicoccus shengliensis]|uniref:DNA-directed RNA polymerase subunit Rpo11 n=1 Tax=Methermicoccus shengliensis TaxID=660064 RepID=A0A832RY29_9EURY|nr:DNA-directed RNA polymerase subunit L [Methermicoccus shengliensis]HIH69501.1 DNA-directed RNA polymerase subunit L [Methermicoccus shengliensis]